MTKHDDCDHTLTRRGLLNASVATGVGLATAPLMFAPVAMAQERQGRILVVLELSGGNDGLNTVVPYGDDAYYRLRPQIGIRKEKLRKLDDHFGLNAGMVGMEKLFKDGKLAIVHGCGYADPLSRTSRQWLTGIQPRQTAASSTDGLAAWLTPWRRRLPQTSW